MNKVLNFTEIGIYKATTGFLAGLLGLIAGFLAKISFNFLRKRNNDISFLLRRITKLESSVTSANLKIEDVEQSLIVCKESGERIPLNRYVKEISHKIDNQDKAEAGAFDEILRRLDAIGGVRYEGK